MKNESTEKLAERAARQIIKADRLPADEIEQLVNAPHLFAAVCARIEAQKAAALAIEKNKSSNWLTRILANQKPVREGLRRPALIAALILISFVSIWYLSKPLISENGIIQSAQNKLAAPNEKPQISKTETLPIDKHYSGVAPARVPLGSPTKTVKNQNLLASEFKKDRKIKEMSTLRGSKPNNSQQFKTPAAAATRREFYQLAFADDLEAGENKQIVRVKLSSAALTQLGIAAPLATQPSDSYTADLLVGENGVPRAIRFVK